MNTFIVFATVLAGVLAFPVPEQVVDVVQDNKGYYKFQFKTEEISRYEERQHDGSTVGSFSYVDTDGVKQTVDYVSGVDGFIATGTTLPVDTNAPVEDTPEVIEARNQHLAIVETLKSLLPKLKEDGTVDETEEVPLSNQEFLAAIANVLHPSVPLVFSADTAEIAEAKGEILKSYATALGQ